MTQNILRLDHDCDDIVAQQCYCPESRFWIYSRDCVFLYSSMQSYHL